MNREQFHRGYGVSENTTPHPQLELPPAKVVPYKLPEASGMTPASGLDPVAPLNT
jgi:hypothetical protein